MGVYIAAHDMQLLLLLILYYIVSCSYNVENRLLFTGNLAITTWATCYGYFSFIEAGNYVNNIRFKT